MPLRLDIKRKFSQRSERVKGVDLHPTEPWLLANLYNGHVCIYNHAEGGLVKSFEAAELPARCAKFVARKQWVAIGSDDMYIRVYNYNTMDRVKMYEAHGDYIRSLAVHPTLPYLLSCSDDMLIKLWDWDNNFQCTQVFEGHVHYVMQVVFNPKDTSTFASASLDRTIKVWSIGQPTPNFTLDGHEKGVNTVDYFSGGDRPYLISGADDKTARVWDYQTKACVQTLEGHTNNVSCVCFHPELPLIVTGSEDGNVCLWHSTTYRLESTLHYGMERVWALGYVRGSNSIGIGYDEGLVMIKMGSEEPIASMEAGGRIIYARHNEVQTATVKALGADYELVDGERLPLPFKDLGTSEIFPAALRHSANGRFAVVCGDGEFVVYTAIAWRNKHFGTALEFVWTSESNDFVIRTKSPDKLQFFKNFKEAGEITLYQVPQAIFGGALVGCKYKDYISFYDFATMRVVQTMEVAVEAVYWSSAGDLVALVSSTAFYILRYDREAVAAAFAQPVADADRDSGVEDAFELITEVEERVRTGLWVGDCFIYNNASWRLNYCVGGEVTTMYHLDRPMYLLGYMAAQQRVYLIDKEYSIVSYTLLLSLVEFKTLVMRDALEDAYAMLEQLPEDQLDGVAKFLESRGHVEKALEVARDMEYRFDLAMQLKRLELAVEIAGALESESRWKQLGETAMAEGRLALAERCLLNAGDVSGLMLMHSATGNREGMRALCDMAKTAGKTNVEFLANFMLQRVDACIDILVGSGRLPEAAFFARTYRPSRVPELVDRWQDDMRGVNAKAAESLATPSEYPNLFPDWSVALSVEAQVVSDGSAAAAAASYPHHEADLSRDLLAMGVTSASTINSDGAHEADGHADAAANGAVTSPESALDAQEAVPGAAPAAEEDDDIDIDDDDALDENDDDAFDDAELGDDDLGLDEDDAWPDDGAPDV